MPNLRLPVLLLAFTLLSSCQSVTVETVDENTRHVYVSRIALHIALDTPLLGDATLERAIEDVKKAVRKNNAIDYSVVSSDVDYSFWRYFPFSLLFQPVYTTVSANLMLEEPVAAPVGAATTTEASSSGD